MSHMHKSQAPSLTVVTKFCTVVPNMCGSSVWNLLHVTIPAPRILRWLLYFSIICASLLYVSNMSPMWITIGIKFPAQYFTSFWQSLHILLFFHVYIKRHVSECWNWIKTVLIRKAICHWRMHTDYLYTEITLITAYTKSLEHNT
jgi:hypothetical protein